MKPYPKTKPSGVQWLGDVPEHWEVKRLKYSATTNDEALPETTPPDYEIEYVDIGGVDRVCGIVESEPLIFENAPSRARRRVRDGDTIVSTVRTYLRAIAPVRNPPENQIVSTGFAVIRPKSIEPDYLGYAMKEQSFVESVVSRSTGVSYPAVNASEVGEIPIPDSAEQTAIAAYLDRETGRIDELVGKKRDLIERLKEKRTALISRTVTRGLPAGLPPATLAKLEALAGQKLPLNPPLKLSGIDWLGDVPEHWDVKPVKRAINFVEGPGIMAADFMEDGVPLLRISCIGGRKATLDDCNYVSEELATTKWAHFRVQSGDLLISGSASTGFCSEVDQETIGAIPYTGIIIIRPMAGQAVRDYVRWFFLSDLFAGQAALAKTGSTIQHFGPTHLSRMVAVLPPLPEQRAIAAYLDEETAKLDALVAKVETAIERLQEYRAALITAAVTGKIDVRGVNFLPRN